MTYHAAAKRMIKMKPDIQCLLGTVVNADIEAKKTGVKTLNRVLDVITDIQNNPARGSTWQEIDVGGKVYRRCGSCGGIEKYTSPYCPYCGEYMINI